MPRDKKLLSHSEELKLKKELEALRKESQHALQMKRLHCDGRLDAPSTLVIPPDSLHTLESTSSVEFRAELLQSPPASLPQSALPPDAHKSTGEVRRDHGRGLRVDSPNAFESVNLLLVSTGQTPAQKPAIAQIAGTTKLVSMSQRPQPPSKPRSERPSATSRTTTNRTSKATAQAAGSEKKKTPDRPTFLQGCRALSTDSSDERGNSSDSNSDHSNDGSARRRLLSRKRRKQRDKLRPPRTSTDDRSSKGQRGPPNMSPTNLLPVKSATELLEEARGIAGVDVEGQEGADPQQRPQEEMVAAAKTLVRESGRTVDEIIASPRSGGSGVPSAPGQIIKELMERVADNEEEQTFESKPEDPKPKKREKTKGTPVQKEQDVGQREASEAQRLVWGKKERRTPRPACHPPASSGVYRRAQTGSEGETLGQQDTQDSTLPLQVMYEDVIVVRGDSIAPAQRPRRASQQHTIQGLSLLTTWAPKPNMEEYKTIHHLCTTPLSQALPLELQLASRACHTANPLAAPPQFHQQRAARRHINTLPDRHRIVCEGQPCVDPPVSDREDCVTHLPPATSDCLTDWQRIAEHYVERPRILLQGQASSLCSNELKMFWSPAPPKFSCPPDLVKHKLFPKYQATRNDLANEELYDDLQVLVESACDLAVMEPTTSMENILSRKFKSMVELRVAQPSPQPSVGSASEDQCKRPLSAPHLTADPETTLKVPCDYATITRELQVVRQQLSSSVLDPQPPMVAVDEPQQQWWDRGRPVLGDLVIKRTSVSHAKRRTCRGRKKLNPAKLAYIHQKLTEPPRTLTRTESLCQINSKPPPCLVKEPPLLSLPRCPSIPLLLDFGSFATKRGGIPDDLPPREWVRDIWDAWFDELFPPLEESSSTSPRKDDPKRTTFQTGVPEPQRKPGDKGLTLDQMQNLDRVDLSLTLDQGLTKADLEAEVVKLTQTMALQDKHSPFDLCRRGALHKKLGCLNQALEDLNTAISLEPSLLDAYWHRHGIYLLRNDQNRALEDLHFIIKHNKKHADAFKSKAEIYRERGETTLAIINYTQAIDCRPGDDDNYFKRAEMFRKSSEILLAMDDYAKTFTINPGRTDAMMIHGLQYFHSCNWVAALADFTLLLQHEPGHAQGRTYRGRIYAKMGQYQEAIEDFSLAVHLDPNDWLAFYHRGCLLRKSMPDMALRDLSTSVLINDSQENLSAFLHRGILYTERRQWQQAVFDFEAVIKLDRSVVVAHVNLGLVYMLKMNQNLEAIRMFSNALRVDPTYIRGYICRAQAYRNVNDLKRALRDLTQATHMKPDDQYIYIMRGQYLCDLEQFDLATFCIQYAVDMNKGLGSSPIQQAAVQSFLGNEAKAMSCLEAATNTRPPPPILILLGKTQMKAHMFMVGLPIHQGRLAKEAVESFRKALILLSPNETSLCNCNCPEAAEVFHLTGLCFMAQDLLLQALDAFSNAVKINPNYADAYHQRGVCRMRLQQSKSVQDFNRALFINPNLFQVYLSRAAFYGAKGRYPKAIINCNQAIKIQPKSVRAFLYRGALKFYLRVYKGAVEDLTMAIRIDNTCSFAHYNRGVCYQQLKEYELALRDYGIVLLFPRQKEIDLKVLINRALLYVELGDHHNTLQDFKAASQISPEDATIHHALGVYHHRLGQLQESVEAYSQALQLSPFFLDAYVGRGNAYKDYGHAQANKQAQRDFLSALHLNPLCSNARISLGYNFLVFGCFQRAWNQFTVASEIDPKCWIALEGRAITNLQMGHTYAAFLDINNALKHHPQSDQMLTNRGVINQVMGDKASAMRDYQRAISINPQYSLAFFNAANLYFYNRQFEQACEYYSQALELGPGDESAFLNRAITRALLRKVPEALQDFSQALSLNPYSSHVFFNRANLYCSLRKYRAAEKDLTVALLLQPRDALVYKLRADVRGHLGLTDQAVQDYWMAVELQEGLEG